MIVLEANGLNGYDDGLNGGLKIASFIKRNVASVKKDVSIKNAIAVGKAIAPLALSIIPVVGGTAGVLASKLLTNADGSANLVGRAIETVQKVADTKVGQSVVNLATPLVKNATANMLQPNEVMTAPAPVFTAKTTQQQAQIAKEEIAKQATTPLANAPLKTDYTPWIIGGVVVTGIAFMALK
jgi:hypothetical protein